MQPRFAVITISDTCHAGTVADFSGPCLQSLVRSVFPDATLLTDLIPDDQVLIENAFYKYADEEDVQAIFTTGGTGFCPRDVTPEATRTVIDRECPQLALAMALESFKKTPFAALSRSVCGIRNRTLIVNLPGSPKAVRECFGAIEIALPHAIQQVRGDLEAVRSVHQAQKTASSAQTGHVCPHKTSTGSKDDRNSPFPMLPVKQALAIVLQAVQSNCKNKNFLLSYESPVDIPPFRASIKDGYALKSSGFSGVKKVVGYIAAGDDVTGLTLEDDECFKINTGAPLPDLADCVIQVEDTKLLAAKGDGTEELVVILVEPRPHLDVRPIGCDLKKGAKLFPYVDLSEGVVKSLLASVGCLKDIEKPKVAVISSGSELLDPTTAATSSCKIYDSNTTMLVGLLKYFGFECAKKEVVKDDLASVKAIIAEMARVADFIVCTGGVSMGDKDYIKPALEELGFETIFGRVNMKPGKPMTFACKGRKYFFGLPGNPVSAFVTFHLFVLPALRWAAGWSRGKCELATVPVKLENDKLPLDPRPEFVRATVTSRDGELFAKVTGSQMSSRLQSILGADVLVHLPARTDEREYARSGETFKASVLRYDFISKYE